MGKLYVSQEAAAPTNPAAGKSVIYPKTDGFWYYRNETGAEIQLLNSSAIPTVADTYLRRNAGNTAFDTKTPQQVADELAGLRPLPRNRVINGGFQVNQRALTSVADDVYCLDRWYVLTESGNVTVAQQTDQENGMPFNLRLTQPDVSAKRIAIAQIIEGKNCKDLRGGSATLGFRVRNSDGGQVNYAILEWSGSEDVITSDVVSVWGGSPTYVASITERAKGTITPAANTWTDVTALTGVISAGTNNIIVFVWSNAAMAQNATLDLGKIQLESGVVATPFQASGAADSLLQCLRYYYRLSDTVQAFLAQGWCESTTRSLLFFALPIPMRVKPTGASSTITDFFLRGASTNVAVSSSSTGWTARTKALLTNELNTATAHGAPVGGSAVILSPAAAWYIEADAEL